MKKLNGQSVKIFSSILQKLGSRQYIKMESVGFMQLNMEKLEDNILTPWGVGATYSLSHSYTQNGDLMRDPEMVFIVVDNRQDEKDFKSLAIYPQMYRQDNLGLYEESVIIENSQIKSFIKAWHNGHCSFANMWLKNIKAQGFSK